MDWCLGRPQPWAAAHLDLMMRQHRAHGVPYKNKYGMNAGYNEVIVDGAALDARLPHSIEAFFLVAGGSDRDAATGKHAHSTFLATYGLNASLVPLLELNQSAWEAPFARLG